jgi:hypothetical protein
MFPDGLTGLDVFRNILQNTPAIVKLKALEPTNEAVVRKAIFEVLKISFHDAVREIPIGQLLKTYKPDLGVRSLMAAAEYKFCSSETELKKSVGEVFSDMKGYEGHHEWRNFYAVFYTTEPILHQDRLEKEFAGVKANANWTPIIVVGRGRRPVKPAKRT